MNEQNLVPFGKMSPERQREISRMGGIASGQARARRAYMRVKARELQLRMVYFEDASEELQKEWAAFQRWRRTERKRRAYHEKKRAGR